MAEEKIEQESSLKKTSEKTVEERKKKVLDFLKNSQLWVILILIIALILGVYIRSLPMTAHGAHPGLWDITTNTWTLGPDLDPWLFLRSAKAVVETGSLPKIDTMRNVPLGFDNSIETQLLPYMIDWTYHATKLFKADANVEYAGVIFPVLMFAFTIIVFFLFVREIFIKKNKESILKANMISLISTFLMIISPIFLSRTVAGIPEKESAAFFFMFLTFYLFLKSWKSEKLILTIVLGASAGIFTALTSLIWGGVVYIYITIAISCLLAFIINKFGKKEFIAYLLWLFLSIILIMFFSSGYSIKGIITSLDTGLAFLLVVIPIIHFILWNTRLSKLKILNNPKIPRTIISLIFAIVLLGILAFIFFGYSFFIDKIKAIHQTIFHPVTGRWSTTVAENRQPDFKEWSSSFGPFIKNIPVLFWLFIIGSVFLFKKMINTLRKKESWILTGFYVLFLFGLIFSRYSSSSIFNGENFISKAFYYVSALLFIGFFIYYYFRYNKENYKGFEEINFEFLLLFSLFVLTLFTARGAVRLVMVLAPVAPIFVGFLIIESIEKAKKTKDETFKIISWAFAILIVLLALIVVFGIPNITAGFYQQITSEAYGYVPSMYNQQWQKAMQWVRNETPENSVFAHWWDYGYWVQSIGNRATVLDGGNAIAFWNYYMGRLVLIGDNQKDSLEFLYAHNATHLLIDSSDIGKYGAFASIGSNENYDRYSWIGTFLIDEKQTQETNNQTLSVYTGGTTLDEDLIINDSGKEIFLPGQRAGVGAIVLPIEKTKDGTNFKQPYVIVVYQNKQQKVNLRYLSVNGEFMDFKSGIESCAFIFPQLIQEGQGIRQNPIGAAMFLSPRLLRGYFAQKYILNDPFKKFPNFKIVHTEQSFIVDNLNNQGMSLPDFVYFQGIQGPIKIWEIKYTGKEEVQQKYLDTDPSKYLSWQL